MDNLQYDRELSSEIARVYLGFKPYYKWITFNTCSLEVAKELIRFFVLNLIING